MLLTGWGFIMRRFQCALLAAVAVFGFASVASAADLPVKAPVAPVAAPYSWTGFYIGANVGGGWGHQNISYSPNDPAGVAFINDGNAVLGDSFKSSGVVGGLQLGYNYQFNRSWLVGLETDFDWTGMKGSGFTPYFSGLEISSAEERVKWFGTVRGRLGYLPTDNLLAYVTGGFAYGKVEHSAAYNTANGGTIFEIFGGFGVQCGPVIGSTTNTCYAGSSSDIATGWTLGGGLEYAIWQRWTLKAEYLYVSLNNKSVAEIGTPVPTFAQSSVNANFGRTNFNVARVGVNYRF
jgi:outer membrane immunogenic protein